MDAQARRQFTVAGRLLAAGDDSPSDFLRLLAADGDSQGLSYRQLLARSRGWARLYRDRGCCCGDRVVVMLPHSADLYAAYLGAVLGGCVPAMFQTPSPKISRSRYVATIGQLARYATPRVLVTDPALHRDLQPMLAAAAPDAIVATADSVTDADGASDPWTLPEADPDATAFVQYSSGTTGLKKGVAISHRALLWQVDAYADAIGLTSEDRIVSWLPLYHDMGLIACCWLPLIKRVPLVAMSPLDWVRRPAMLLKAIDRHQGTLCWLPNFAYHHIAAATRAEDVDGLDLSSLRAVINCSEPVSVRSHQRLADRLAGCRLRPDAFRTCYAMAETTFAITSGADAFTDSIDARQWAEGRAVPAARGAKDSRVLLSSGRPLPQTRIRIVDQNGSEVPERTVGEILVQSPSMAAGYVHDAEATAATFVDGWLHTGDLGYRAGEQLFVTGRKKDLLIISGKNIWPEDIESLVNEVDGVVPGRCVALGVADPSSGAERLVVLAESRRKGRARREQIRRAVFEAVAAGADVAAHDVEIVDHMWLIKSSSGKIARGRNLRKCREFVADRRDGPSIAGPPGDAPVDRVCRVVAEVLAKTGRDFGGELTAATELICSGLIDSLHLVRLILAVEAEFGLTLADDDVASLDSFDTPGRIASLVTRSTGSAGSPPPAVAAAEGAAARPVAGGESVRDYKCADFLRGPRDYDLLILGSSRTMALSAALANRRGYRAYNFSVNSAMAEDWYCIFRFFLEHNRRKVRRILLSTDIESFSSQLDIDPRLLNSPHLSGYLDPPDRVGAVSPADGRQDRFTTVRKAMQYKRVDAEHSFGYHPRTGDLVYLSDEPICDDFNHRRPVRIAEATSCNQEYRMRTNSFGALNPKRLGYLLRTVQPCVENGLPVTCFLAPMHDQLKRFLAANTEYPARRAEFVAGINANNTPLFQFLDCTEPGSFGGDDDDFIDAAHVGGHNADLLLNHLLDYAEQAATVS